jgi:hypothetical protein
VIQGDSGEYGTCRPAGLFCIPTSRWIVLGAVVLVIIGMAFVALFIVRYERADPFAIFALPLHESTASLCPPRIRLSVTPDDTSCPTFFRCTPQSSVCCNSLIAAQRAGAAIEAASDMPGDAVEALSMDDFDDDVDALSDRVHFEDQENAPPKRTFSKPIFASPSGMSSSRPVTANSSLSELEEMSLDHGFAPPNHGAYASRANFTMSGRTGPAAAAVAVSPGGFGMCRGVQSPPWSPASNAIPSLDEYEEPPATPAELSRALPVMSSANHVASAAIADVSDLNATVSPTPSEKAKKDGCAVM